MFSLLNRPLRFGVRWHGDTPCCIECRTPLQPVPSAIEGIFYGRADGTWLDRFICPSCGRHHRMVLTDGRPISLDQAIALKNSEHDSAAS